MIEIEEKSFIILIVDQFVDNDNGGGGSDNNNDEQSTNTDDLLNMMKLVPFTSVSKLPIYTIQQRDITKVRRQLNIQNYILTSTYKVATNIMYACKQNEINEKVTEYMKETNAYFMIHEFNENISHSTQMFLEFLCQRIKRQLDILYNERCINAIQYASLNINRSNVQLDQLYFIPDLRKYDIPFQPTMISYCGPTTNIARYIYHLIAPIYYDQIARQTTFSQGNDVLHAVELYHRQGLLRPTTLFATIQIRHLSTLFPHAYTMKLFECFLHDSIPNGYIQGLSIKTILKLVHFILSHQYFIYQNKFYHQIKGGPSNIPLTHLLADIYLFYWQKQFVHILHSQKEIFGRCFDQIFLTWNQSKVEFINLINKISHDQWMPPPLPTTTTTTDSPPPLQLTSTIGSTINYMDVEISHFNGVLQTKVFHQCLFEPYCLPYMTDHPPYQYLTLIRAALLRAVQYCTHIHDFETEINFIRLSLLLNHFSATYIKQCFKLFQLEFKLNTKLFRYNQHDYNQFRACIKNSHQSGQTTLIQQGSHISTYDLTGTNHLSSHYPNKKNDKKKKTTNVKISRTNSSQCPPSSKRIKLVHH